MKKLLQSELDEVAHVLEFLAEFLPKAQKIIESSPEYYYAGNDLIGPPHRLTHRPYTDSAKAIDEERKVLTWELWNLDEAIEVLDGFVEPRNGNSKLTPRKVAKIREIVSGLNGNYIPHYLAVQFGVSEQTIERVVNRETW